MRAVVFDRFGPPEHLRCADDVPRPVPRRGELLVRVAASPVSAADLRIRAQHMPVGFGLMARLIYGFGAPRQPILGSAFAGTVAAVGDGVTAWRAGDAVLGMSGVRLGAHADYLCLGASALICRKPEHMAFDIAAGLPFGGTTAVSFLDRARIRRGETVLVNGASGAAGSAAVQVARALGAHVIAVCSAQHQPFVRSLGAHEVIDYARQDFTAYRSSFDVVFDAACAKPLSRTLASVRAGGRCIRLQASLGELLLAPWTTLRHGKRVIVGAAGERAADLQRIIALWCAGQYRSGEGVVFSPRQAREAHEAAATGDFGRPVLLRFA